MTAQTQDKPKLLTADDLLRLHSEGVTHPIDGPVVALREDGVLDGDPVLPGFACPVRDIFDL